jgi:hypothetical protein
MKKKSAGQLAYTARQEKIAFARGAYDAFSYVLNYLNTLDEQHPDKAAIYKAVMNMTPLDIEKNFKSSPPRRSEMHDPGGRSKPPWPKGSMINDVFSTCGFYRYELTEVWDAAAPAVMFLMMNPSVAGVEHSDPTLIRTGNFARKWGYGAQHIGNIHAYRATNSDDLMRVADPIGPENDVRLLNMAARSETIVLAYGQPPKPLRPRARIVVRMLAETGARLTYLRLSKDGTPCHPLYLPSSLMPIKYEMLT